MKERAQIYTYSIVYSASEAFKDMTPYVIAVLDDGQQKIVTRVENYQENREVKIGMEVAFSGEVVGSTPIYKFIDEV
ncbi:MAG: OB-fold domain-containing protein [Desulfitobacteriaceae bacterium]